MLMREPESYAMLSSVIFFKEYRMQTRKNIWCKIFLAWGLETITLCCWMSEANPKLTKSLLLLTLAVDAYVLPKMTSFFYKTYKESKDFVDLNINLGMPFVSDLYKKKEVAEGVRNLIGKCCRR